MTVSLRAAPTFGFTQSAVYYRPSDQQAAEDVAAILGNAQTHPMTGQYRGYAPAALVVVVGKDFHGTLAHAPPAKSTGLPPDIKQDAAMFRADFSSITRAANFPVLYPTVYQDQSQFQPWTPKPVRVYNIKEAGKGGNSLYAYWLFDNIAGAYWGIEETRFVSAPILTNPDQRRKLDRRTYQFYFNGTHIHLIAFISGHTAYWVQNTLRDDMSNADMIAIARSLKPLH